MNTVLDPPVGRPPSARPAPAIPTDLDVPMDVLPTEATPPAPLSDPASAVSAAPAPARSGPWAAIRSAAGWTAALTASVAEWVFGVAALVVALAALSAVPLLQFLSLGYLLECAGRVARTGRLRDGLVGVRKAARIGGLIAGGWLVLLPLRLISTLAESAEIIDPGGRAAEGWRAALVVLTGLAAVHILASVARGGRLLTFLWPLNIVWLLRRLWSGGWYAPARDTVCDAIFALRLPYFFWLGVRGFAGGLLWLALPVGMLAAGHDNILVGWLGALLLIAVLPVVAAVQTRFAAENRFRAFFEYRPAAELFLRTPWAFAVALFLTLLLAVPLHLLKIEMIPREAAWLPGLLFIVFNLPARLATGWAAARAGRRERRARWWNRWAARMLILWPAAAAFVGITYLSRFTAWEGAGSLFAQHAFLLPSPFSEYR